MADEAVSTGELETPQDAEKEGARGVYRRWMSEIKLAQKNQKDWENDAEKAIERFRDEKKREDKRFNILYSAVSTVKPQLYNSTPVPDVRRRFSDQEAQDSRNDYIARAFERGLSYSIDSDDFEAEMKALVHDGVMVGRGVPYIEYRPQVAGDGEDAVITHESVHVCTAHWQDVLFGPAKKWKDVPWIALRFRLTRQQATKLNPDLGKTVNLDYVEKGAEGDEKEDGKEAPSIFKRLTVWKIWDRKTRRIIYIAPSYNEGPFKAIDDPLKLKDFYPFPRPYYDTFDSTTLTPVIPYNQWKDQAEELDILTRRIQKLTSVLRWRGVRPANIEELDNLADLDDGELMPSESFDMLMNQQSGKAEDLIWLWPIEKLITVIRELVVQRDVIKQTIFEISGLSDVQRGATDPNETLGAQQLKAQFGSVRLQERQDEVQRVIRDLFQLMAEVIGERFSDETLEQMTQLGLPAPEQKAVAMQAVQLAQSFGQPADPRMQKMASMPTWEELRPTMSNDAMRCYNIDIETNSTILGDLGYAQENITRFIEGLGAFGNAVGPAVESGLMPGDVVADLLTPFTRMFKLGRQAEEALERWGAEARQKSEAMKNAPPQPDPEAMKAQADAQAQQAEIQAKQAEAQTRAQEAQAEAQRKARQMEIDHIQEMARIEAKKEIDLERMREEERRKDYVAAEDNRRKTESANLDSEIRQRNQAMSEDGAKRETEASENASLAPLFEAFTESLQRTADAMRETVDEFRQQASAPVRLKVVRKNGKMDEVVRVNE